MLKDIFAAASSDGSVEHASRRLSCRCSDLLLPAVLSTIRNSVPRGDVAVQRVTSPSWIGERSSRSAGASVRASRSGEILRRKEIRRLHLEAHAGFLFLRRLRALLRQLSGQCGGPAVVAAVPHHQGERLPFQHFPLFGKSTTARRWSAGIYSEDEIWSCTTCGACEEECPLLIEYIDKIVDLRRGMIDDGNVPKSIQKALKALESRGNPYGKMEKKRADWTKDKEFQQTCNVKVLDGNGSAETLYFVDSITSYDDRIQAIGRATARILDQRRRRLRQSWARRKKTAATTFAVSAKRCCSWRCATTTPTPSRHRASSASSPPIRTPSTRSSTTIKICRRWSTSARCIAREVKVRQPAAQSGGERRQRLHLSRSLLSGPAQPGLRRSARCAGRDSRPEAG